MGVMSSPCKQLLRMTLKRMSLSLIPRVLKRQSTGLEIWPFTLTGLSFLLDASLKGRITESKTSWSQFGTKITRDCLGLRQEILDLNTDISPKTTGT